MVLVDMASISFSRHRNWPFLNSSSCPKLNENATGSTLGVPKGGIAGERDKEGCPDKQVSKRISL